MSWWDMYLLWFETNMAAVTWEQFSCLKKENSIFSVKHRTQQYWKLGEYDRLIILLILDLFKPVFSICSSGSFGNAHLKHPRSGTVRKAFQEINTVCWQTTLCCTKTVLKLSEMEDDDDLTPDSPPGFVEEIDSSELENIEVSLSLCVNKTKS